MHIFQAFGERIMIHLLQDFEQACERLMPLMLFASGSIGAIVGLVIWLGGSALRRLSLLIVGTLVGFVFGLSIVGLTLMPALLVGLLAGAGGALVDKPAIGVLTAVLVVVIVFCFLGRPFMEEARPGASIETQSTKMDWTQSVESVKSYAIGFDAAVRQIFWKMPRYYWAILAGAAAGGGLFALTFPRTAMAFCFGTSGAIFLFAGMMLLLLQRANAAISGVFGKPPFYAAVFGGMAAFGMCIQLMFCKPKKGLPGSDDGSSENGEASSGAKKKSWRTRA